VACRSHRQPPGARSFSSCAIEAMARGEREYAARVHKVRDLWIAVVLAVFGAARPWLRPSQQTVLRYASALLMIAACAFAILLCQRLTPCRRNSCDGSPESSLPRVRSLAASLRRTSVLVAHWHGNRHETRLASWSAVSPDGASLDDNQLTADLFLRPRRSRVDRHPTSILTGDKLRCCRSAGVDRFRAMRSATRGCLLLSARLTRWGPRFGEIQFLSAVAPA